MFYESLCRAVGESGNICVPAFTYSFCNGQDFDPANTPTRMGMLAEYIRCRPEARRSEDANFSVAVIGPDAAALTEKVPERSFGLDSFWDRLLKRGAKLCNMNFDAGSTYVHYLEKQVPVPYRYDKPFGGRVWKDGVWQPRTYIHFVRHLDKPHWDTSMTKVDQLARERGLVRQTNLGRGSVLCLSIPALSAAMRRCMEENPYYFTVAGKE